MFNEFNVVNSGSSVNVNINSSTYNLDDLKIGTYLGKRVIKLKGEDYVLCPANELIHALKESLERTTFTTEQISKIQERISYFSEDSLDNGTEKIDQVNKQSTIFKLKKNKDNSQAGKTLKRKKAESNLAKKINQGKHEKLPAKRYADPTRTQNMHNFFSYCKEYNPSTKFLNVGGEPHEMISSEIVNFYGSSHPLACCGTYREALLLDDKSSPLLTTHFKNFKAGIETLKLPLTPSELLDYTMKYINNFMFSLDSKKASEKVDEIVENSNDMSNIIKLELHIDPRTAKEYNIPEIILIPCISIDKFIGEKAAVCRHHSLVAAYFLDRLFNENNNVCTQDFKVQMMRDDLSEGAHTWISLITENHDIYILDSYNKIFGNIEEVKTRFELITRGFGGQAIENHLHRALQALDKYYK